LSNGRDIIGSGTSVERRGEPQRGTATATVLLVEDEEAVRELVRMILQRAGYSVMEAANADEAETLLAAAGTADLLLTDVLMPGRSGFELFTRLRRKFPSLRVLFISGYSDYAMSVEGNLAFLEKPFSAEGLIAKIREVLGH
jgi:two-component system, cell cycle sensor histidine kinase and response regulator CckA